VDGALIVIALNPTLDHCALQYAEFWFATERPIVEALAATSEAEVLRAIARGASYFRIARNLSAKAETSCGMRRYEPVLNVLRGCRVIPKNESQMIAEVCRVRDELSRVYGRRPLSAASKFLWLWRRDPFLIYDTQARVSLRSTEGDYEGFVRIWMQSYGSMRSRIVDACSVLPNLRQYLSVGADLPVEMIESVVAEEWFLRRVHDVYLWRAGRPG
jgi:hypothetical protein